MLQTLPNPTLFHTYSLEFIHFGGWNYIVYICLYERLVPGSFRVNVDADTLATRDAKLSDTSGVLGVVYNNESDIQALTGFICSRDWPQRHLAGDSARS